MWDKSKTFFFVKKKKVKPFFDNNVGQNFEFYILAARIVLNTSVVRSRKKSHRLLPRFAIFHRDSLLLHHHEAR